MLEHGACPACHEHPISEVIGAGGTISAPDHEYPSSILLRLTAADGELEGTTTRRLQPRTVRMTFATAPAGLRLNLDGETATAPFTRTAIVGSAHFVEAPAAQGTAAFRAWSDGAARAHNLIAPASPATYTAAYTTPDGPPRRPPGQPPELRVALSGARTLARKGVFHVRVTCDVACTAKVAGTARKRGARRALRPKHLLRHEARGHRLQAGVETRVKAVLRRSGRRAVRSALA